MKKIKTFNDLKKLIETNTRCELEYISPKEFEVLEPFNDSLDGEGWSKTTIEHNGTVDSMIKTIIEEDIGFDPYGGYHYYGDVVELLKDYAN